MVSVKKWSVRIAGIVMMAFGLLFGGTINRFQYCLGDTVFSALGIPVWSNGATGTHYPAIIGLLLILIGAGLLNVTLQKKTCILAWAILILALIVVNFALMHI